MAQHKYAIEKLFAALLPFICFEWLKMYPTECHMAVQFGCYNQILLWLLQVSYGLLPMAAIFPLEISSIPWGFTFTRVCSNVPVSELIPCKECFHTLSLSNHFAKFLCITATLKVQCKEGNYVSEWLLNTPTCY